MTHEEILEILEECFEKKEREIFIMTKKFIIRRTIATMLTFVLMFSLAACGSSGESDSLGSSESESSRQSETVTPSTTEQEETTALGSEEAADNTQQEEGKTNILVAYFSMPETSSSDNMTQEEDNSVVVIDGEVLGNTQYVAYLIEENTGADIFRIEPAIPYPTDHDTLVDLAKEEQNESARPELAANVENIEQYDVIFLGYPNWWGDMPMIMYTFLESVNLSGKTIIPFNTHGGSGFSDTINTIANLQPDATVDKDGFTVSRNNVADSKDDVSDWLSEKGMLKLQ